MPASDPARHARFAPAGRWSVNATSSSVAFSVKHMIITTLKSRFAQSPNRAIYVCGVCTLRQLRHIAAKTRGRGYPFVNLIQVEQPRFLRAAAQPRSRAAAGPTVVRPGFRADVAHHGPFGIAPARASCCLLGSSIEEQKVKLSARNQLAGTVIAINQGAAIANVELDVQGQRLVASITVEAVEELDLRPGTAIIAVIKASDVIIATS